MTQTQTLSRWIAALFCAIISFIALFPGCGSSAWELAFYYFLTIWFFLVSAAPSRMRRGMRELRNTSNIVIVGFDAIPEARAAISEGSPLKADAIQYPEVIGRRTMETVYRVLHGEQVPALVAVPVGIVDRDSLMQRARGH